MTQVGMGTENVSPLLGSIVRMIHPKSLLEIGAGMTTLFLLSALDAVRSELLYDRSVLSGESNDDERLSVLVPREVVAPYNPVLTVFEDFSVQPSTADVVTAIADERAWSDLLRFVAGDFFAHAENVLSTLDPLDLVWLDAGDPVQDIRFLEMVWPHLHDDAYVIMHEPFVVLPVSAVGQPAGRRSLREVRAPVLNELIRQRTRGKLRSVDFMVFPERHKCRQGGMLVIHKHREEPSLYNSYPEEMNELTRLLNIESIPPAPTFD
jgi:predicted O-methyltransferase YrrM